MKDASSMGSKSTVSAIHRAIEIGKAYEEPGLLILRRLLLVVLVMVIGLSLATMDMSKAVIREGFDGVTITRYEGKRQVLHQV